MIDADFRISFFSDKAWLSGPKPNKNNGLTGKTCLN